MDTGAKCALREQLGAAVWCDSEEAVEQQRLDKRWQREMGVERRRRSRD